MARIGGPKFGVGTVNTRMPTISSTAMAAWVGPDDLAAEREHAPIGRDHANLRQRIDTEQAGRAKRDLREPVSERRPEIAGERELMADRQQLARARSAARRRTTAAPRATAPPAPGCQPEHQHRPRTQALQCRGVRRTSARRDTLANPRSEGESEKIPLASLKGANGRGAVYRGNTPTTRSSASAPGSPSASATGENERR